MTLGNFIIVFILFLLISLIIAVPITLILLWFSKDESEDFKDIITFHKGDRK